MEGRVLKIREIGDPILRKIAKIVGAKDCTKETEIVIADLKATLAFGEGYGIAAPQIGYAKCIVVIEVVKTDGKYQNMEEVPNTVMINPIWKPIGTKKTVEFEGCLSVPSIRGKVKRYEEIEVEYETEKGNKIKNKASGFLARLIQHECDHLKGEIFIDKVEDKGYATSMMIKKFDLD